MPITNPAPIPADAPKPGSRWTHWKGENIIVVGTGRHSETGELVVSYFEREDLWIRPLAMWADEARPGIIRFRPLP